MEQLVALLLGLVASALQKDRFKRIGKRYRFLISLVACVIMGLGVQGYTLWAEGTFSGEELLANIGMAFAASQTYYNVYFRLKK